MAISWTHHEAVRRHRSWRPADVQWSPANLVTQQLGSSSHGQKYVKVWYPQRKCSISNKTIVIFRRKTASPTSCRNKQVPQKMIKMEVSRSFCPQRPEFLGPIRRCVRIWVTILQHLQLFPLGIWMSGCPRKCLSRILVVHCVAKHSYLLPMWASYLKINRHMHMHIHTYVYTYPCAYKYIRIHIQYIYGYIKSNSLHYI